MNPFNQSISRRGALQKAACGFGSLALAGLCADSARAANLLAGKFNKFLSLNQQAEVKLLGFLDALEGDLSDIENCTIDHFAKLGADECKARV